MHASNHSPAFFKTTLSFIAFCMVAVPSVFCRYLALLTLFSRISQNSSGPESTLAGYEVGELTLFS